MSGYDRLARDLKRHIRDNPRLQPLPTCKACGLQKPASQFVGDLCRCCELERATDYTLARLDEIEQANRPVEEGPDGLPPWTPPRDEIVDNGFDFEVDE